MCARHPSLSARSCGRSVSARLASSKRRPALRKRVFQPFSAGSEALCAIWQSVKADSRPRPPFRGYQRASVWPADRSKACFGTAKGHFGRSMGWISRTKASFRWEKGFHSCHIVAKTRFSGGRTGQCRAYDFQHQQFTFFVYSQATERAHGKNAFSVLKSKGPFAVRPGWHIPCGVPRGKFDPFGAVCMCELSFRGFACVSPAVIE